MAKLPSKPKKPKDPAKPTRAKAARPDSSPLDPALADLLNPAIAEGRAGMGSQTGLQQPPDNSFDRRADFANAHKARKSTQGLSAQQGLGEQPQSGYVAKGPAGIDPELADALGYGDSDPTKPLTGEAPAERDELADIFQSQREKRHRPAIQPVTLGVTASMQALEHLLREGRESSASRTAPPQSGRRTGRRARTNPKAAGASSSSRISIPRATSRRRSPTWSKVCAATIAPRCCWASPARAKPSPSPR